MNMNRRELAQQKKQVERDRYIAEQARKMRDNKPLPTPDKLELSHIYKLVESKKNFVKSVNAGFWLYSIKVPEELLSPIERELSSVEDSAHKAVKSWEKQPGQGTLEYWDCLQELMVKEWKRRQSKLYRALK